jgi:hypothetical protein
MVGSTLSVACQQPEMKEDAMNVSDPAWERNETAGFAMRLQKSITSSSSIMGAKETKQCS